MDMRGQPCVSNLRLCFYHFYHGWEKTKVPLSPWIPDKWGDNEDAVDGQVAGVCDFTT